MSQNIACRKSFVPEWAQKFWDWDDGRWSENLSIDFNTLLLCIVDFDLYINQVILGIKMCHALIKSKKRQ